MNTVPSSVNLSYYAEIIQRKHILRRLIEASDSIGELGYNESGDLSEILESAEKKIFGVTNMTSSRNFVELKHSLEEAFERLDRLHKSEDKIRGVPTGFRKLDNLLPHDLPWEKLLLLWILLETPPLDIKYQLLFSL